MSRQGKNNLIANFYVIQKNEKRPYTKSGVEINQELKEMYSCTKY